MAVKIVAGVVAVALMLLYFGPIVVKLRDPALAAVVLVGLVMMLVDLWQSLQSRGD